MTAKQRIVLAGLRDAQHARDGEPVNTWQIASLTAGRWQGRAGLVDQALVLLVRDELARRHPDGRHTITTAGRQLLAPRRGPARARPLIGSRPAARAQ